MLCLPSRVEADQQPRLRGSPSHDRTALNDFGGREEHHLLCIGDLYRGGIDPVHPGDLCGELAVRSARSASVGGQGGRHKHGGRPNPWVRAAVALAPHPGRSGQRLAGKGG